MEDVGGVAGTPRTVSLARSDSQDALEASTRASTLTENRAEHLPTDIDFLKPSKQDDTADDVTMKDVSPDKDSPAGAADEFANQKVVPWPSTTVIDPGSLLWKAGKTKGDPVDDGSDTQNTEELLRLNHPDSPDLYKP